MIAADLVIYNPTNALRANLPTDRAFDIVVSNNKHGFGSLSFKMNLNFAQLINYLGNPQTLNIQFKRGTLLFDGRLEDVSLAGATVTFVALGYWRAISDFKYNALWSASGIADWFTVSYDHVPSLAVRRTPEKYAIDYNNRIFIGLVKGNTYTNSNDAGNVAYSIPNGSTRNITGIQYDLEFKLPANWRVQIVTRDANFLSGVAAIVHTATGAVERYATAFNLAAIGVDNAIVGLEILNLTGANYNMAGETGTFYAKITDARVVSTASALGRWINTALTVARTAGTNVTATVATTANMYVGQQLVIDSGLGPTLSEIVTVLSIPSATTFVATFANNHAIGAQVSAVTCYPDQIASDILTTARSFNSTQLSSNTALIQQNSFDVLNEVYTDAAPDDILDYLAKLGDGTQQYEVGVFENKQLFFRPRNASARQFYIDYNDPQIRSSIDQLYNNVYTVYANLLKNDVRTAQSANQASISKYGVQRETSTQLTTTNATLAVKQRDLTLANLATITPQADIAVTTLFSLPNNVGVLYDLRPSDYVTILNMPAVAHGTTLDKIRTFRVVETKLDFDTGVLTIVPEFSLPVLDYQIANLLLFASRQPVGKTSASDTRNFDRRQT